MWRLLIALLFSLSLASAAQAFHKGTGSSPATPYTALNMGGGGRMTGMSITTDNYLINRVDVYGAYMLNATAAGQNTSNDARQGAQWQQLVNSTSLHNWLFAASNFGSPALFNFRGAGSGVQEVVAAPSNPKHMVMWWMQGPWYSTDRGNTWTQGNFAGCNCDTSNNQTTKNYGQKIAFDPANENIVYAGSGSQGMYYSTDGGVNWTQTAAGSGFPSIQSIAANGTAIVKGSTTVITVTSCVGVLPNMSVVDTAVGPTTVLNNVSTCTGTTLTLTGAAQNAGTGGTSDALTVYPTSPTTGISAIIFDPSGGQFTGVSNPNCPNSVSPCTKNIYASAYTVNGGYPYVTTNAGTSWATTTASGGPTAPTMYGKVAGNGVVFYLTDDNTGGAGKNIWMYTGGTSGTWTSVLTGGVGTCSPEAPSPTGTNCYRAFALDPFNCNTASISGGSPCRMVVIGSSLSLNVGSYNGSTVTWTGWSNNPIAGNFTSPDSPWNLQATVTFWGNHTVEFDQVTQNKIWSCPSGLCFFATGLGSSVAGTNFAWKGYTLGIQNLVSEDTLIPPGSPNVFGTGWDKWLHQMPARNANGGQNIFQNVNVGATTLGTGFNMDYASSAPNFVYVPAPQQGSQPPGGGAIQNGFFWTQNYGQTWAALGDTNPAPAQCGGGATTVPPEPMQVNGGPYNYEGAFAASTPCNFIYASFGRQPYYTLDGGHSWTAVSLQSATSGLSFRIADNAIAAVQSSWTTSSSTIDLAGSGVTCSTQIFPGEGVIALDSGSLGSVATVASPACTAGSSGNSTVNFVAPITRAGSTGQRLYFSSWLPPTSGAAASLGQQAFIYRAFVADRVLANTFYFYWGASQTSASGHTEYGVWKSTNGGAAWTQLNNSVFSGLTYGLLSVPGKAGMMFGTGNMQFANGFGSWQSPTQAHPVASAKIWFIQDTGSCAPACNPTQLPFVLEPMVMCLGKPAVGQTFPAIYVLGFASTNSGTSYSYGLWRSTTFNPASPTADPAWTLISDGTGGYPGGNAIATSCSASQDNYGEVYFGSSNYNWQFGVFP